MRRLAVISDLHADVHALADALREIDRIGCEAIVCCGDLVDYGLFPDETLTLLAERKLPTVRGNHDRWSVESRRDEWDLSRTSRKFLSSLPVSLNLIVSGVRVAVHHASPRGDMDGIYPDQLDRSLATALLRKAAADVLIVGHTHVGFALNVEGVGLIVNPAAVLRSPAESAENPPATGTFGVLHLPGMRFTVHRVLDGAEVDIIRRRVYCGGASDGRRYSRHGLRRRCTRGMGAVDCERRTRRIVAGLSDRWLRRMRARGPGREA